MKVLGVRVTPTQGALTFVAEIAKKTHLYAIARRSESGGEWIRTHQLRAEKALGRPLPAGAQVHHADGSKDPNAPLVICENAAYHRLLHARMRVKEYGGNPNTDAVCGKCKLAKPRSEFYPNPKTVLGVRPCCAACERPMAAASERRRRQKRARVQNAA